VAASRDLAAFLRAWIGPLAGLGLVLYANVKVAAACGCGGEPAWGIALLGLRGETSARGFFLTAALGVQIGLCLLTARNKYVQVGVVLAVVAILIAPDMRLLADSRLHAFSPSQWQDALASRNARVMALDFLALFVNLATALYRSNAYILKRL